MSIYTMFPFGSDKELGKKIHDRLVELGYNPINNLASIECCSIKSNLSYGEIMHTIDSNRIHKGNIHEHELGSLNDLFYTEKYRCRKLPIKVVLNNMYTAEVTDKEIKVVCVKFDANKVKELTNAIQLYKDR